LKAEKKEDSPEFGTLASRIADSQIERQQQEAQFDMLVMQSTINVGLLEGLCFIGDALTIREEVVSKTTGKRGYVRYTTAMINDAACSDMYRLYRRTRKIFDLLKLQY